MTKDDLIHLNSLMSEVILFFPKCQFFSGDVENYQNVRTELLCFSSKNKILKEHSSRLPPVCILTSALLINCFN